MNIGFKSVLYCTHTKRKERKKETPTGTHIACVSLFYFVPSLFYLSHVFIPIFNLFTYFFWYL